VKLLRRRLDRLAQAYLADYDVDVTTLEGAGSAGGLAGGLAAVGATLLSGFDVVAEEIELPDRMEHAQLVVTGEGFLDGESFEGKVVGGVAALAADLGVATLAVVGQVYDGADERVPTVSLVERFGEERARRDTEACITDAVRDWLAEQAG
jgi:glycerate kinase